MIRVSVRGGVWAFVLLAACTPSPSTSSVSPAPASPEPERPAHTRVEPPTAPSSRREPASEERSVRPGINDAYFEPEALAKFTGILEAESREVVQQRDAIVDAIGLVEGMRVADVGAGTGLFTMAIAERVGNEGTVFAVDVVPAFLDRVEALALMVGHHHVTTVLGGDKSVGLSTASVDLAFMCATYHHIEYPQAYMRSLFRALRPGGTLMLIDFERIEGKTPGWRMRHVRAGKETVIEEVTAAGFVFQSETDLLKENYVLRFIRSSP